MVNLTKKNNVSGEQSGVVAILITSILLMMSACGEAETVETYQIERLTPEWFMVKGISDDTDYSDIFAETLKDLAEDYTIIEIVPITAQSGMGSMTVALYVKIEPK